MSRSCRGRGTGEPIARGVSSLKQPFRVACQPFRQRFTFADAAGGHAIAAAGRAAGAAVAVSAGQPREQPVAAVESRAAASGDPL